MTARRSGKRTRLAAGALALLTLPGAALAQDEDCLTEETLRPHAAAAPVQFQSRLIRGTRVLVATGMVDAGAADRLDAMLAGGERFDEIWWDAQAVDSEAAMALGLHLRRRGLPMRLRAGQVCAGACAEAFLGGVLRIVEPGARLGFSRGAEAAPTNAADQAQSGGRWAERRADYYIRTGVSRGLLRLQLSANDPPICYLTEAAMTRFNVTNRLIPADR
jgi:hypothetical protein